MPPDKPDESPRNFNVFLAQVGDGALHSDLSRELQDLISELTAHAENHTVGKGKLTLSLAFRVDARGVVDVDTDIAVKLPKKQRARGVFWTTPGGNLTAENPKQTKLALREVPTAAQTPIDIPKPADAPARSI